MKLELEVDEVRGDIYIKFPDGQVIHHDGKTILAEEIAEVISDHANSFIHR